MKATEELHSLGQSLWLDNITRDLLGNGTLQRYIDEFSITGLISIPAIFEHAISKSKSRDAEIGRLLSKGLSGEELFSELVWCLRSWLHKWQRTTADLSVPFGQKRPNSA